MNRVKECEPALLFVGMLYSDPAVLNHVQQTLEREFGGPLLVSPSSKWDYSLHYKDELGWPLLRQFVFFKNVIDPETLADIKVKTNEIEDSFSVNGKRQINLDPGYLTLAKIVLASTKNYAHRVYLRKGIYGEITLFYPGWDIQTAHFYLQGLPGKELCRHVYACTHAFQETVT